MTWSDSMARWQIERTVVGQLVDATNHVLDHLGRCKMRDEGLAGIDPELVRDTYGGVRWLRNHLQRRLADAGSAHDASVDLTLDDQNLLASCAMFEIIQCDLAIADVDRDPIAVNQARALQVTMADWAVRLATRMPTRIPGPDRLGWHSTKALAVEATLRQKLHPGPELIGRSAFDPAELAALERNDSDSDSEPPAAAVDIDELFDGCRLDPAGDGSSQAGLLPVDPRRIRHPSLRGLVSLDLRAFERSLEARDARLAMLHLCSVFEAVVIDYALDRQQQLQLQGAPESWSLEQIVRQILGDDFGPLDHSNLTQLLAARNNARPVLQLDRSSGLRAAPALDSSRAFANRVFQRCGVLPAPSQAKR